MKNFQLQQDGLVLTTAETVQEFEDCFSLLHDAYVGTLVLAAAGDLDDVGRWVRLASRVVAAWAAWSAAGRALGLDVVDPPAMLLVLTSVGGAP